MIGESSINVKDSQRFKCQGYGHIVAQCPSRNLLVREADDDEIETVVYEPTGSATDSNDDVRVSSIQLSVVRCSRTAVRDEDQRRSSVFHPYVTHEKNYKLMVDGGNCANIITKTSHKKMGLKAEPHSYPYLSLIHI